MTAQTIAPLRGTSDTASPIIGFLATVRPCSSPEHYQRGRSLVERMATAPALRLTPTECADVLHFLRSVQPFDAAGYYLILETLERSIRPTPMHVRGWSD